MDDLKKDKSPIPGDDNQDLPADLLYPAEEDILNPANSDGRVDVDVDNMTRAGAEATSTRVNDLSLEDIVSQEDDDELAIVPGTEADVTKEDLLMLGRRDEDMDLGDDENLKGKGFPLDLSGDDLDVPGAELDDANEEIGEEDEENNYYSLGGDSKESLDEDASGAEV